MNLKKMTFVDRYIDKIILSVGAIFFIVVVWVYFVGNPYAIELSKSEGVAPAALPEKIKREAELLGDLMDRQESPLPQQPVPDYRGDFDERYRRQPVQLADAWDPLNGPGLDYNEVGGSLGQRKLYVVEAPTPPSELKTRADYAVLLDGDLIQEVTSQRYQQAAGEQQRLQLAVFVTEQYRKLIGDHQPRDFRAVSVSAVFDMDQWGEKMRAAPEAGRIPEDWWRTVRLVTDVKLERETLDAVTGQWGDRVIIDPLPGNQSFRNVPNKFNSAQAQATVQEIFYRQEEITRPPFAPTTEQRTWMPPGAEKEWSAEDQQDFVRNAREIAGVNKQINRLDKTLERRDRTTRSDRGTTRRTDRKSSRRQPSRGADRSFGPGGLGGFGGMMGQDMMGPGRGGPRPGGDVAKRNRRSRASGKATPEQRLQQLYQRLDELELEREELILEMLPEGDQLGPGGRRDPLARQFGRETMLGRGPGGMGPSFAPPGMGQEFGPMGMGGPGDPRMMMPGGFGAGRFPGMTPDRRSRGPRNRGPRERGQEQVEEEVGRVTVWAHDLTVQPGTTYRYRVLVSVINPLFGREMLTPEQKEQWANKLSVTSEPSPWSESVKIDPKWYLFLVADSQQRKTVDVEVFTIFDGAWQSETFPVRAGDAIGRQVAMSSELMEMEVDLSTGFAVVDLDFSAKFTRDRLERTTTEMLYMDLDSGELHRRSLAADGEDGDLKRLRFEQEYSLAPQARAN